MENDIIDSTVTSDNTVSQEKNGVSFFKKYIQPNYTVIIIIIGALVAFFLFVAILIMLYFIFAYKPREEVQQPVKKTKKPKPQKPKPETKGVSEQEKKRANDIQEEISAALVDEYKQQQVLPHTIVQSDTETEEKVEDEQADPIEILDD